MEFDSDTEEMSCSDTEEDDTMIKLTKLVTEEEHINIRKDISDIRLHPRIYLANYFSDMRRQVDMAYETYSPWSK